MGEVDGWIPDWFPKVEKEESRKWEPVDGIQEKIICLQHFVFLFIYELETWSSSTHPSTLFLILFFLGFNLALGKRNGREVEPIQKERDNLQIEREKDKIWSGKE